MVPAGSHLYVWWCLHGKSNSHLSWFLHAFQVAQCTGVVLYVNDMTLVVELTAMALKKRKDFWMKSAIQRRLLNGNCNSFCQLRLADKFSKLEKKGYRKTV